MWHNLFSMGASWQEKALRAAFVYVFLVIAIKVFGRRELGQITTFDIIVLLTLSNILQNAMIGNDNSLTGGIIGAVVLLSANLVLAFAVFRSRRIERVVEGEPRFLVVNGELQTQALKKELLTVADVLSAVRRQGLEDIERARFVIVEPDGMFSVIPMPNQESDS
jgi:uncharacterized membrane protein YcaP (DUF421 family)